MRKIEIKIQTRWENNCTKRDLIHGENNIKIFMF